MGKSTNSDAKAMGGRGIFTPKVIFNTSSVALIYLSNRIGAYILQRISLNHFDWDNQRSITSYQIG